MINPSLDHCIWIKEKGIVFIYIPKVACTSWKIYLWQIIGNKLSNQITYKTVHNGKHLALPYVGNMKEDEKAIFMHKLREGELIVCGMIRDPKARVLSGYLDKVLNHNNPNSSFSRKVIPSIRAQQKIKGNRRPTFGEFLEWNMNIELIEKGLINDHWRQMHKILGVSSISEINEEYINLWDITHLDTAADWFNKQFDKAIEFPGSQSLGPRPTNNSEKKLEEYYGEREISQFERMYKLDIEMYQAVIRK